MLTMTTDPFRLFECIVSSLTRPPSVCFLLFESISLMLIFERHCCDASLYPRYSKIPLGRVFSKLMYVCPHTQSSM